MHDFINNGNTIQDSSKYLEDLLYSTYGIQYRTSCDVFLGLNLQWPTFELPNNYNRYLISFHTEYIDVHWIIAQALRIYPKPILLVTDFEIDIQSPWPDNITSAQYITLANQLEVGAQEAGIQDVNKILKPRYKISSLSFRISQSKKFITAYLLKNFPHNDMILTYNNVCYKIQDHHGYPPEFKIFDTLDFENLSYTQINFSEDTKKINLSPVSNSDWNISPYTNALVNLTNESFHYSETIFNGEVFQYPGPYLTEKTFKPLLAGRPFMPVGQGNTCKFLNSIGLSTSFGFNLDYDQDLGDLTRISALFHTIDQIQNTSIDDLYEQSLPAVKHNINYIITGNLADKCNSLNQQGIDIINNFL